MHEPVLRVENVSKMLGGKQILSEVSLSVEKGQLKLLIGPSGGGKSTLLQCINHLIPPDAGRIFLEGRPVEAHRKKELYAFRRQVGMIFQDFNLFDHLTAIDNVTVALRQGPQNGPGGRPSARRGGTGPGGPGRQGGPVSGGNCPEVRNNGSPSPGPWPWTPR